MKSTMAIVHSCSCCNVLARQGCSNNIQKNGNNVRNDWNENIVPPIGDWVIFRIINTINNNITAAITEYSATNASKAFLLCIPNVQRIPITVAIRIAYKKYAIFEDNL